MVIKAKDINHARFLASNNFGYDTDQISIFTLKEPSKSLWGLINHKGLYQVLEKDPSSIESSAFTFRDGTAQIKNGEVLLTDPTGDGRNPTIVTKDINIDVYLNDQKVEGEFTASTKDVIKLCPSIIDPKTNIEVYVAEDKMTAELIVARENGRKYFVRDTKADSYTPVLVDHMELPSPAPTLQQCMDVLETCNIKKELINIAAIESFIMSGGSGSVIAATGKQPVNGMNGKIKYSFADNSYRNPELLTDKKVNLLDHTIRPTVKSGDILAIKISTATKGINGYNVYGNTINCIHGKEIEMLAGDNVVIEDTRAIALINGRPYVKQGRICVNPVMLINKDIDAKSGNVKFDGDIDIKGNVTEGIKVQAEGSISVYGSVYDSTIDAKGNIRVYGNIISSQLTAGYNVVQNMVVLPHLEVLLTIIDNYAVLIRDLKLAGNDIGKFLYSKQSTDKNLSKKIQELKDALNSLNLEEPKLTDILTAIENSLIGSNALHINSAEVITKPSSEIRSYIDFVKSTYDIRSDVFFEYCQNSFIQASGSIISTGKGSYSAKLIASKSIAFKKPGNIVRGGMLIAGKNIEAGTLGSPAGIKTYCRVLDRQGKIKAVDMHINTTLNIGGNIKIVN